MEYCERCLSYRKKRDDFIEKLIGIGINTTNETKKQKCICYLKDNPIKTIQDNELWIIK